MELLRFYLQQNQRHGSMPTYQWLLQQAHQLGASGGTAFHALGGFGRHGWHQQSFFELAGDIPVAVEIVAEAELLDTLIRITTEAAITIPWLRIPVRHGYTGPAA
ncbi:DUF190 domain-containing protein [Chitinilyticum piscinae]|uniref:DUF190 domain-containing protein n=1 Tax=Chitinilyticum piscinae TaxID=2866724 RepID=A0A8J7G0Z1_9NEIS|nr:DUF190 domain-containing protein [Chitinilyticum piscinae]MBE9609383.1 DUF190 domain-containing protein [Chitinilyticum piscinae]